LPRERGGLQIGLSESAEFGEKKGVMLDAIIFDIGNVLLRFDFNRAILRVSPQCSVDPVEMPKRIEPLKNLLESGQLSNEEFLRRLSEAIGYRGPEEELVGAWQQIFDPVEETHELVEELQGRLPLYLLSNTNALHARYFLSTYRVFNHFAGSVYSHRVQMMKPDQEIYEYAIVEFGLNPGRTLFVDDLEANVRGAREAGLLAHHYRLDRHADLLTLLHSHGLKLHGYPEGEGAARRR
jgi:HAD superfamily hydrolase (TIGR01509 family)